MARYDFMLLLGGFHAGRTGGINWDHKLDFGLDKAFPEMRGQYAQRQAVQGEVKGSLLRWFNHLDQTVSKKSWNKSEERLMFELHQTYGNKWKEIAKLMKSRYSSTQP